MATYARVWKVEIGDARVFCWYGDFGLTNGSHWLLHPLCLSRAASRNLCPLYRTNDVIPDVLPTRYSGEDVKVFGVVQRAGIFARLHLQHRLTVMFGRYRTLRLSSNFRRIWQLVVNPSRRTAPQWIRKSPENRYQFPRPGPQLETV